MHCRYDELFQHVRLLSRQGLKPDEIQDILDARFDKVGEIAEEISQLHKERHDEDDDDDGDDGDGESSEGGKAKGKAKSKSSDSGK